MWKMNDSLLQSSEVLEELTRELRSFFSSNVGEDSAPMMVWEAHKCYIRGLMIKIGSRMRQARAKQIVGILEKIRTLESIHKKSLADKCIADLTILRSQLRRQRQSTCYRKDSRHLSAILCLSL